MIKQFTCLLLIVSFAGAASLGIVIEKNVESIIVKDSYVLDSNPPDFFGADSTHYVNVAGTKYPVNLKDEYVLTNPSHKKLFNEKGEQVFVPEADNIYTKKDSYETTIIVPFDENAGEVTIEDNESNVLATIQTEDLENFFVNPEKQVKKTESVLMDLLYDVLLAGLKPVFEVML